MGTCSRKGGPGGFHADDGYIKDKLSVALQVLSEVNRVRKEDAGLELNVSKTSILPKGTTQLVVFDVAHSIIAVSRALTQLGDVSLAAMSPLLLSVLKVSLVLVYLLVLMLLYRTL